MDYKDRYNEWMEKLPDENPLKQELTAIAGNEAEIEERFYKELSFGTAGLRGKTGAGTNRMNVLTVGKATQGIADYIKKHGREAMDRGVVIAHDPRHFSKEFSCLAAAIFAANGIKAYTFPDLRPTPELAYMVRRLNTFVGVNVTASHNPKEYNGYKVYGSDGCQVASELADEIQKCINAVDMWNGIRTGDETTVLDESLLKHSSQLEEKSKALLNDSDANLYNYGLNKGHEDTKENVSAGLITMLGEEYDREYLDKIMSVAIHHGDELELSIPFVYTPLNGCGYKPFKRMLERRGFTAWHIVEEQSMPDPDFTTVGYPNPEDPKAFKLSEEYGRRYGAEFLMATDPDADRFAIEIRDPDGNYIPLNGNQTGYILVNYILEGHKSAGTLPKNGAVVRSIVTSTLCDIIAEHYGVTVFETLTGFKNLSGKVPYLHEHGYKYLFAYEESVGYAACEDIRDKDGISAGMLVAEAAAYYKKQGKSLYDVLNEIYERYGAFAEDEPNIVLDGISGAERIKRMMAEVRKHPFKEIAGHKVTELIDYKEGYRDLEPTNALKFVLDNGSWFAMRPSGTEPKIKFYFYSKQPTREEALNVNAAIRQAVLGAVNAVG